MAVGSARASEILRFRKEGMKFEKLTNTFSYEIVTFIGKNTAD